MEFKIEREPFLKSISRAYSITDKSSNMPILSTVLVSAKEGKVDIFATDLEISFQENLSAEVYSEGSAAIPCKKLLEVIRESKGREFYIKEEENQRIFISDGNTEFRLASLPAEEFIITPEPQDLKFSTIEASDLRDMIKKTIYNLSTIEDIGYKFSGIFVQKKEIEQDIFLRFVSTDGSRLSLIDKKISGIEDIDLGEGIFVPKKGMTEINKIAQEGGPISIGLKDKDFIVKKENRTLMIRLLDVKFPNYEGAIPKDEDIRFSIKIQKERLIEALRRMLIFTTNTYKSVIFLIKDNQIELISSNIEVGEAKESMEIEYEKGQLEEEEMKIAFNPRFLIDAIQPMKSDFISMSFMGKDKACLIRGSEDPYYLSIIMPMRI